MQFSCVPQLFLLHLFYNVISKATFNSLLLEFGSETIQLPWLFFVFFPYFRRQQYVDVYIDYYLNKSVEKQFQAFATGFHRVCGGKVMVSDYFALLNGKCLV